MLQVGDAVRERASDVAANVKAAANAAIDKLKSFDGRGEGGVGGFVPSPGSTTATSTPTAAAGTRDAAGLLSGGGVGAASGSETVSTAAATSLSVQDLVVAPSGNSVTYTA
jgi:hypothetical protein